MPPPPALPEELLEEIFLRLPPDEPACLVRASLTSKLWLGILTGTRFRGLYREHHGSPPMLGFIYSGTSDHIPKEEEDLPYFVATTKLGVRIPGVEDWRGWHKDYTAWDCRHGRVLFSNTHSIAPMPLVVWDPMTGRRRLLHAPDDYDSSWAAVLCNVTGCNHGACHDGSFQVVFVGLFNTDDGCVAYAHVSLPEVVQWSKPCSLDLATEYASIFDRPPIFIQDALYFMLAYEYDDDDDYVKAAILKYDLVSNCLTLIDAPPVKIALAGGDVFLLAMDDGSLGFVHVAGLTLNLWLRHMGSNGVASWPLRRVINLETLIPIRSPMEKLRLIGSVEGTGIIFLTTELGIYEINLKSLQWKKLLKREKYRSLFPYMSFYNPPERVSFSDAAH